MRIVFYISIIVYTAFLTAAYGALLRTGPVMPDMTRPFWVYAAVALAAYILSHVAFSFFRFRRLPFIDRPLLSLMPAVPLFFGILYFA